MDVTATEKWGFLQLEACLGKWIWRGLDGGKDQSLHKAASGDGSWAKLLVRFEPEEIVGSGACRGLAVVVLQAEGPGSSLNYPGKVGKDPFRGLVLAMAQPARAAGPVGSALCLAGVNLTPASVSPREVKPFHSLSQ